MDLPSSELNVPNLELNSNFDLPTIPSKPWMNMFEVFSSLPHIPIVGPSTMQQTVPQAEQQPQEQRLPQLVVLPAKGNVFEDVTRLFPKRKTNPVEKTETIQKQSISKPGRNSVKKPGRRVGEPLLNTPFHNERRKKYLEKKIALLRSLDSIKDFVKHFSNLNGKKFSATFMQWKECKNL